MKTLLSLALLAVSAWAQTTTTTTPNTGPNLTSLKTYLSLTDAQVQALQTIQTQLRSTTSSLRQQIAEKQKTLAAERASGSASASALGQLMLDIQALQKQTTDARDAVRTQAVAVLTTQQKTLLQNLEAAAKLQRAVREAAMADLIDAPMGGGPGGRGFGGPGGPGGRGFGGPGAASADRPGRSGTSLAGLPRR